MAGSEVSQWCRREFQEGIWGLEGRRRGAVDDITFKMNVCAMGEKKDCWCTPCRKHDHENSQRGCTFLLRRLGCQWWETVSELGYVNDTQVVHDESPIAGDAARSNRIIEDNLCLS